MSARDLLTADERPITGHVSIDGDIVVCRRPIRLAEAFNAANANLGNRLLTTVPDEQHDGYELATYDISAQVDRLISR